MNENHYDSIINTMKEDIFKFEENLSKIKNDKKIQEYSDITNCLNSIERKITEINTEIDKIAKKKQKLEQEKKKLEQENQEPPTN